MEMIGFSRLINQIGISRGSPLINFLSSADPSSRGPVRRFLISPSPLSPFLLLLLFLPPSSAQSLPRLLLHSRLPSLGISVSFVESVALSNSNVVLSLFRFNEPVVYNRRVYRLPFSIFKPRNRYHHACP